MSRIPIDLEAHGAIFDPESGLFEQVALHDHENDEITNPKQA